MKNGKQEQRIALSDLLDLGGDQWRKGLIPTKEEPGSETQYVLNNPTHVVECR